VKRAVVAIVLSSLSVFGLLVAQAATFYLHISGADGSGHMRVVHLDGLTTEAVRGSSATYCLAGPATLVSVWLTSSRLKHEPGGTVTFQVERLGTTGQGRMDVDAPAIQKLYRSIEGGGWRCH
jgi:hypothetical protein